MKTPMNFVVDMLSLLNTPQATPTHPTTIAIQEALVAYVAKEGWAAAQIKLKSDPLMQEAKAAYEAENEPVEWTEWFRQWDAFARSW